MPEAMSEPHSYRARMIFPVEGEPLPDGYLTLHGERITAISPDAPRAGTMTDLGDVAILPGLVNAHTHLEFSDLAAPLGRAGLPFSQWIPQVVAHRRQRTAAVADSIERGLHESLRAGVTLLGEITTTGWEDPARYAVGPDCIVFQEVLGKRPETFQRNTTLLEEHLARRWQSADATIRHQPGISPHTPYTVSEPLFAHAVKTAAEADIPVAFHLAESAEEMELLHHMGGPLKDQLQAIDFWNPTEHTAPRPPLGYLQQLSHLNHALVVHGNYLNSDEIAFLGQNSQRLSVIYCPRTHAYFGHPRYPLPELLAAGACVAIGTDSRASNPDLALLDELKFIHEQYPAIPSNTVLRLGTQAGAQALGQAARTGSLLPGKEASLIAVKLGSFAVDDVAEAVLAAESRVVGTMLRGRWVAGDEAFLERAKN